MSNFHSDIINAATSALTNNNFESIELLQPKLITNEKENDIKILSYLINRIEECDEFYFSSAFLTNSGLASLYNTLKNFSSKPNKIGKIIVSDYLCFTQPEALERISKLGSIETRLHSDGKFHGKGYLFKIGDKFDLLVGSANLTANALCINNELNLHISASDSGSLIDNFKLFFEQTFNEAKQITEKELLFYRNKYNSIPRQLNKENNHFQEGLDRKIFEPNLLQVEAIDNLNKLREEHEDRALVVSATGTGKTILSAFDVRNFRAKRMLFVVHRRNIAKQAMDSYKEVFGDEVSMGIYSGSSRDAESKFIFSTIQTISKDQHLANFESDYFDYVIIDETHRAGAETYQKIID